MVIFRPNESLNKKKKTVLTMLSAKQVSQHQAIPPEALTVIIAKLC